MRVKSMAACPATIRLLQAQAMEEIDPARMAGQANI
jgi:hypothetical protein